MSIGSTFLGSRHLIKEALKKRRTTQTPSSLFRNDLIQQRLHFNGYDISLFPKKSLITRLENCNFYVLLLNSFTTVVLFCRNVSFWTLPVYSVDKQDFFSRMKRFCPRLKLQNRCQTMLKEGKYVCTTAADRWLGRRKSHTSVTVHWYTIDLERKSDCLSV